MKYKLPLVVLATALALTATGCSSSTTATSSQDAGVSSKAEDALAQIKGQVLSKRPNGEEPSPASVAELSADDVAKG